MPFSRGSSTPGIEPMSLVSIALAGRFSTTNATWEALLWQSACSQFILTSLVAQTVKNLPAMQETQVCIPGVAKSQTRLSDFHFHLYFKKIMYSFIFLPGVLVVVRGTFIALCEIFCWVMQA